MTNSMPTKPKKGERRVKDEELKRAVAYLFHNVVELIASGAWDKHIIKMHHEDIDLLLSPSISKNKKK